MRAGRWTCVAGLAAAAIGIYAPTPAAAATQLGGTFVPPLSCSGSTIVQSASNGPSYAAPSAGVITGWAIERGATPLSLIKLKVARPAGGNSFTIIGESPFSGTAPNQVNVFSNLHIAVQPGDVIGFFHASGNSCGGVGGNTVHALSGDQAPGTTATFAPTGGVRLDVSAVLEPDADGDGFGDETQDNCPLDADTHVFCPVPDTTITKRPKHKTKKKRAAFEFTSSLPDSTFECSLDDGPLAPCSSPYVVKVKKGKHSLLVHAVRKGQVDTTPPRVHWLVKKKK